MVNILLEGYAIDKPWLYDELKKYILPKSKVAVIALSFRDGTVKNLDGWNKLYEKGKGEKYIGIVNALRAYGIDGDDVSFINYFEDTSESARGKIKNADIIYFLGGLADKMLERIRELDLYDALLNHKGVKMGYSAGAVIQMSEYHLSPDHDYPEFAYYEGIPYTSGFYLEVHYENNTVQNEAISRVLREKKKPVFATHLFEGAIIVEDGVVRTVGKTEIFKPN